VQRWLTPEQIFPAEHPVISQGTTQPLVRARGICDGLRCWRRCLRVGKHGRVAIRLAGQRGDDLRDRALVAIEADERRFLIGLSGTMGTDVELVRLDRLVRGLLLILASAVLMLVTSFVVSGFHLAHRLPQRFPGREKLIELSAAYHLYAHHWRATLAAFGASLAAHLGTFATFLCVAFAFRAQVGVIDFFAIMPIERTISSLPISFAGVGLREKIFQIMLHGLCGVPEAVAVLIGSMSFLVMLVCCAPGGIVYFFYKPSGQVRHVKLSEMRMEVATLEHEITENE
jgi:hypothetical protein